MPTPPALLRPYRQGELDALCALYAVVNAVRLLAQPHQRMSRAACVELFASLVGSLAARGRLQRVLTEGSGCKIVARALTQADRWLGKQYDLGLRSHRPFRRRKDHDRTDAARILAEHLAQPGQAAIVATPEHWTVATAMIGRRLQLFDSSGRSFMRSTSQGEVIERLWLKATFLLQVRPATKCTVPE